MTTDECIALFTQLKLDKYEYDRMYENNCKSINKNLSYNEFLAWNITCINELTDDDKLLLQLLCNKILNNKMKQMDLESCAVFESHSLFYDTNKNLVIVNPR